VACPLEKLDVSKDHTASILKVKSKPCKKPEEAGAETSGFL
jgi:hypothetical protein